MKHPFSRFARHLSSFQTNPLISGTLLLTLTGIFTRCIGFFYRLFLARSIGPEALGTYQLVFPIFIFALSLCCGGMQTAISRYTSATDPPSGFYLYRGTTIAFLSAVTVSVLIYVHADFISGVFLQEPSCRQLLQILAPAIPFACVHSCINAYYYGIKKASVPAISQMAEQITRVAGVFLLFRIFMDADRPLTAAAAIWGILMGETAATLISVTALSINRPVLSGIVCRYKACKDLCAMAIPLTLNRVALSLFQTFEQILIPAGLKRSGYSASDALALYGVTSGMALSSILLPTVLTGALSSMLLPQIAKAQARGMCGHIRQITKKTVLFSLFLGCFCTLFFFLAGPFAGTWLFHNHLAGAYIQHLSLICPFLFSDSILHTILQGLGRANTVLLLNLFTGVMRILLVMLAVPLWGIRGYLWGMILSQAISCLLSFLALKKQVHQGPALLKYTL